MAFTPEEQLRLLLDEPIPEGGLADDTLFSEQDITNLLALGDGDVERAAYEGWRMKAAKYSGLVDVTEGNASRSMSDLADGALAMMKLYERSRSGPTEGRTRIGKIVRKVV